MVPNPRSSGAGPPSSLDVAATNQPQSMTTCPNYLGQSLPSHSSAAQPLLHILSSLPHWLPSLPPSPLTTALSLLPYTLPPPPNHLPSTCNKGGSIFPFPFWLGQLRCQQCLLLSRQSWSYPKRDVETVLPSNRLYWQRKPENILLAVKEPRQASRQAVMGERFRATMQLKLFKHPSKTILHFSGAQAGYGWFTDLPHIQPNTAEEGAGS